MRRMRGPMALCFVLSGWLCWPGISAADGETAAWLELRRLETHLNKEAAGVLPELDALRSAASGEADTLLHARIALLECAAQYRVGHLDVAREPCDEGNVLADQVGTPEILAQARNARAAVAYASGDTAQAFSDYEAASGFAEATDNLSLVSRVQNNLGVIVRNSGAVLASLPHFQKALEAARSIDDHPRIALAHLNLSDTYIQLEQYDSAEEAVGQALEHARQGGMMRWLYAAHLQRASLLIVQGRGPEALVALREIESSPELAGEKRQEGRLRVLFADAYRLTGDLARAHAAAEEAVAIAEAIGDRWRSAQWRVTLARVSRLRGESERAIRIIERTERFARTEDRDRLLQEALVEKSEILNASGRTDQAYLALKESREIERRTRSRGAAEQLAFLSRAEETRRAHEAIVALEERSTRAETTRNGVLLALVLVLTLGSPVAQLECSQGAHSRSGTAHL